MNKELKKLISPAAWCIGIDKIEEVLKRLEDEIKVPIISVGSGNGYIESKMKVKTICVDPISGSFASQSIVRKPDYEISIEQFAKENKEYVGNCVLFINWASPNDVDASYDMNAVTLLKPLHIVAINALDGSAGSAKFHDFMMTNGTPTLNSEKDFSEGAYKLSYQLACPFKESAFRMNSLVVMSLKKMKFDPIFELIPTKQDDKSPSPIEYMGTVTVAHRAGQYLARYKEEGESLPKNYKLLASVADKFIEIRESMPGSNMDECVIS